MNCMQSAEEAYKERVGKFEYNFIMEELNQFAFMIDWEDFSHEVEKIIKNHLEEAKEHVDSDHISRAWKETIWLEEVNLNNLFSDNLHRLPLKREMNKYLSDEDIKHRYYEFFSHIFNAAMDFLEDEKNGLTNDDDEEIDDLLRDDEEDESTEKEDN